MRRLSVLGLGLLAAIAALAATAATALAVQPSNLPEKTERAIKGKSEGTTVYHGTLGNVTCQNAVGEGEEKNTKPPSGTVHIMFSECTGPLGEKCTGLGETTGIILVLLDWVLPFDREKGKLFSGLTVATLFTILGEVHFTCGLLLVKTKGETLCLDLEPTSAKQTHSYHCFGKTATEPAEEWCMVGEKEEKCEGEWLVPKLESSENGGEFKPALELALGNAESSVTENVNADI